MHHVDAGWSSLVARRAHNPKVIGSNPVPATKHENRGNKPRFFVPARHGTMTIGSLFIQRQRSPLPDMETETTSLGFLCPLALYSISRSRAASAMLRSSPLVPRQKLSL